jgi:hypothetical protein
LKGSAPSTVIVDEWQAMRKPLLAEVRNLPHTEGAGMADPK